MGHSSDKGSQALIEWMGGSTPSLEQASLLKGTLPAVRSPGPHLPPSPPPFSWVTLHFSAKLCGLIRRALLASLSNHFKMQLLELHYKHHWLLPSPQLFIKRRKCCSLTDCLNFSLLHDCVFIVSIFLINLRNTFLLMIILMTEN